MPEPIVIVHGWSDRASSFKPLAGFLQRNMRTQVARIDLADWLSLNDEVTYRDLREAMEDAWNTHPVLKDARSVSMVSHSTGALVVRDWMTWRFKRQSDCPIHRHLMLAPANYGSPLAHKGRSFLGRVVKGRKTGFQTGTHILHGLEIASPYTWELAEQDVFAGSPWYGKDRIMATVLVGNSGYGGARRIVNEDGSDGTVRVSTANLNAARAELHFSAGGAVDAFNYREVSPARRAAFGVVDGYDHASITRPEVGTGLGDLVLKALRVTPARWAAWMDQLDGLTGAQYDIDEDHDRSAYFDAYQNTVVKAYDDLDNPVEEYIVEFRESKARRFSLNTIGELFHRKVISHVHNYRKNEAYRSFYLNVSEIERHVSGRLALDIDPQPVCSTRQPVGYYDVGTMQIDDSTLRKLFQRNRTVLLDVRFKRQIDGARTFKLQRYP